MHAVRAPAVQCRTATRVHVQPQRGKVQAQVLEAARQLPDAHHSFCVSCCVSPPPPPLRWLSPCQGVMLRHWAGSQRTTCASSLHEQQQQQQQC